MAVDKTCSAKHSSWTPGLFKSKKELQDATNLFQFVELADYLKAAQLAKANPELMFVKIQITDSELLSPLQYSIKMYDAEMWLLFLDIIKSSSDESLMQRYIQQLHEPVDMIDLEPLFDAYKQYCESYNSCYPGGYDLDDDTADDEQRIQEKKQTDAAFRALGHAQGTYLPWNMIRLMCYRHTPWSSQSTFSIRQNSRPPSLCVEELIVTGPIEITREYLLTSATLMRNEPCPIFRSSRVQTCGCGIYNVQDDLKIFQQLLKMRTAQLEELKKELTLDLCEASQAAPMNG